MGRSSIRIVRDAPSELLHQFAALIASDNRILCDMRYTALARTARTPFCQILLVTPADAPGLVIGGMVCTHLPHSELSYLAALYIRPDFRGRKIGRTLFDEFCQSIDHPRRIAFCDLARVERARIRPSSFPVEGRYSIRKVVGYAENVALAGAELITAYDKVEEEDSLPEVCSFPHSLDMEKIADFDSTVAGRNRSSALAELRRMEGFVGLAAIDRNGGVIGYAVSMPGRTARELVVGPLYAINLVTAVCLLRDLCFATTEGKTVTVYVPHMGHRMLRFLQDKALCEVDKQFDRLYTKDVEVPVDDFSKVFAISAQILMPDC